MSFPGMDPWSEQTAVYRGANQTEALQQFSADTLRARDAGYLPISQEWAEENGQTVLTVRYSKAPAPAPQTPVWAGAVAVSPMPEQPAIVVKKPVSKVKVTIAAVLVVVVGLVALGGTVKDKPTGAVATTVAPSTPAPSTPAPETTPDTALWDEFSRWAIGDLPAITDDLTAIADRANALDVAGTMDASRSMKITAMRLLGYLSSHPAAACYAGLQSDISSSLTSFVAAGTAGGSGDFETATAEMMEGSSTLDDATAGIPTAAVACTS